MDEKVNTQEKFRSDKIFLFFSANGCLQVQDKERKLIK